MSKGRKRHALGTRIWHWINVVSVAILFMSGLNISNAHRRLYWGDWGFAAEDAWLEVPRFPGFMTIPGYYSLAAARDWHVLFAWVLALGLLLYMLWSLANGHFRRDLKTGRSEWKPSAIMEDIRAHLRFDFEHGAGKYNFLQKVAYASVIFVMIPLMIFTGLVMSPGWEAAHPWMTEVLGGRQSARSIHFITAWALFAFFVVHIVLVLLTDPARQIYDMITGGDFDEEA